MIIHREGYNLIFDGEDVWLDVYSSDEDLSVLIRGYQTLVQLRNDITLILGAALVD